MSKEPKIIFPCDHSIVNKERCYGDVEITRNANSGNIDVFPLSVQFLRIDRVLNHDKTVEYTENIDYFIENSTNSIRWLKIPQYFKEKSPTKYFVRGLYVKTTVTQEDEVQCSRCFGNGWYVNVFSSEEDIKITGFDKLLQDIIKYLFTERQSDGYGSELKDLIAEALYDEIELRYKISEILNDCSESIKYKQQDALTRQADLSLDETLSSITLTDVYVDYDESTCYITISIKNAANEEASFVFKTE